MEKDEVQQAIDEDDDLNCSINWVNIESSTILKVAYENRVLLNEGKYQEIVYIQFKGKNGTPVYEYQDVKKEVYDEFIKSESKGKYFHSNIKDKYQCDKITTLDEISKEYKLPQGTKDEVTDKVLKEVSQNLTLYLTATAKIKLNALISFRDKL